MPRYRPLGGVVFLALAFGLVTDSSAETMKMTCEEFLVQLHSHRAGEARAKAEIVTLDEEIAALQAQVEDMEALIAQRNAEILALVGATEAEVADFGLRLDALLQQLEGLAALAPEELQWRQGELTVAAEDLAEMRMSKIAALPEMKAKIDRAGNLLAELMMRAPKEITYEVMKGDHLWGIASKPVVYDDPYMWPRIYRANKEQISDPDLIYPKQKLHVPIAVGEDQYLVTSGDFLTKIAEEVYNDPTMWHKIYKANKQQIMEPNLVFPAQVLDIPSK